MRKPKKQRNVIALDLLSPKYRKRVEKSKRDKIEIEARKSIAYHKGRSNRGDPSDIRRGIV